MRCAPSVVARRLGPLPGSSQSGQRPCSRSLLGRLFCRGRISLGLSVLIGGLLHQPKGSQPRGLILHGLCLRRLLSLRLLACLSGVLFFPEACCFGPLTIIFRSSHPPFPPMRNTF